MAVIAIPAAVRQYLPETVKPENLWVHFDAKSDSLLVYFDGHPVDSVWTDVDSFAYIGLDAESETIATGIMIEHFSKWLLSSETSPSVLQFA